jgi:hypothetical protein
MTLIRISWMQSEHRTICTRVGARFQLRHSREVKSDEMRVWHGPIKAYIYFVNGHVLTAGARLWEVDQSSVKVDPGTGAWLWYPSFKPDPDRSHSHRDIASRRAK